MKPHHTTERQYVKYTRGPFSQYGLTLITAIVMCGMKSLSHLKLQRLYRWSLVIGVTPHVYLACNYLSMLGLKLICVSKRGYRLLHKSLQMFYNIIPLTNYTDNFTAKIDQTIRFYSNFPQINLFSFTTIAETTHTAL